MDYGLTVIMPTILNNTETWTNITKKEMETMEKMQIDILTMFFKLPISTPYWGILAESGCWPVSSRILYRKLMLLHNLVISDEKRIAKKLLMDKIKKEREKRWYVELKEKLKEYEISEDIEAIKGFKKSKWKKMVKEKIRKYVDREYKEKSKEMKNYDF